MEISVWANFMFKFFFSDYAFIDCKLSVNFKFIMCENKLCLPHERLCVNPVNVFFITILFNVQFYNFVSRVHSGYHCQIWKMIRSMWPQLKVNRYI